jgi:hypothetical protein
MAWWERVISVLLGAHLGQPNARDKVLEDTWASARKVWQAASETSLADFFPL